MTALIVTLLLQFDCPKTITPQVVKALISRESSGYANRVSDKGAIGLMQVMPHVVNEFNKDQGHNFRQEDLFTWHKNIQIGIWQLCRFSGITQSSRDLLQIYFVGIANWKDMQKDHDHRLWGLWVIAEKYVESIYYRVWLFNTFERVLAHDFKINPNTVLEWHRKINSWE